MLTSVHTFLRLLLCKLSHCERLKSDKVQIFSFTTDQHSSLPLILLLCRYCNQVLSKEIDESVTLLLQELVRFQERVYQKDPTKAKSKRRLVMGLREVTKHMKLHKIKCVIISPNCEKIQAKGDQCSFVLFDFSPFISVVYIALKWQKSQLFGKGHMFHRAYSGYTLNKLKQNFITSTTFSISFFMLTWSVR